MGETSPRVLIADDEVYFHELLRLTLERAGMHVVGVAGTGERVLAMAQGLQPDVILLDIKMPDGDGLEVLTRLARQGIKSKVIMLSGYGSPDHVEQALERGASGYLSKEAGVQAIIDSIHKAGRRSREAEGKAEGRKNGKGQTKAAQNQQNSQPRWSNSLTQQERHVLSLVAKGMTTQDIAQFLCLSSNTVKTHLSHIYCKLGVSGRTAAAVWALRHGLAA